jgi:hypothetical protein
MPVATLFKGRYYLAFSSGDALTETGSTLTVTDNGTLGGRTIKRVRDTTGTLDDSVIRPGMHWVIRNDDLNLATREYSSGIVSAKGTTGGDPYFEASDYWFAPTTGNRYRVIVNDRCLVYDITQGWWSLFRGGSTGAKTAWNIQDFAVWHAKESGGARLFASLSTEGHLEEVEVSATTTDTGSTAITSYYETTWKDMPADRTVMGIKVHMQSPTALSLTLYTDLDDTTAAQTITSFTPSKSNHYTRGCFVRGRSFKLAISGTAMGAIDRVSLMVA